MNMLGARIFNIWKNFIISQLLLMLIIGIATYFSLKVLGVPYALGLSVLAGVCEGIPHFGPVIAATAAIIIAYIKGSTILAGPKLAAGPDRTGSHASDPMGGKLANQAQTGQFNAGYSSADRLDRHDIFWIVVRRAWLAPFDSDFFDNSGNNLLFLL